MDASAPEGGDGSRDRPFKSLKDALSGAGPGDVVHLASGLYRGPFELPERVVLRGGKAAVLFTDEPLAPVVVASKGARLERLHLQGGAVGLDASADVELDQVRTSGQREAALQVHAGALRAYGCHLEGSIAETRGVVVGRLAEADLVGCTFAGAFRRAVEVRGGDVRVVKGHFRGPVTGVHQVGGEVALESCDFAEGRGPAIFVAQGRLVARRVTVYGHEYALQTGQKTVLEVADFASVRAERAALGLVGTRGRLSDVVAVDCGSFGCAQLVESDLELERIRLARAPGYGLFARRGRLRLKDAVVTSVRSEGTGASESGGDGIYLHGTDGRLEGVTVMDARGAGLVASAAASASVRDFVCERCRFGALFADGQAQIDAISVRAQGSEAASVVVPGDARVRVDLLFSQDAASGPVWAECENGALVEVGRIFSHSPPANARCIGKWRRPGLAEP